MENERVVISQYGPPSVLTMVREPIPVPGRGEIRIKVQTAGVSFGDVAQRSGLFFAGAPEMPYTPGYDVAGTVDALGDGVTDIVAGDRVAALTLFGGYTRYICVPAGWVVKILPDMDPAMVVALVLNYTSAWQMLQRVARVRRGDSILVYGGSGGVGTALLDLAKHFELVVAAGVSKRWQDLLRNEADLLFDEREPASRELLRRFRPAGFNAAFDPIGGSHVWKTRSFVAPHGKLVPFGISGAVRPGGRRNLADVVRLGLLLGFARLWKRPEVELYAMDRRIKTDRHEINADLAKLIELLGSGEIAPRIGARFALHEVPQAHERLESRNNVGKIVLIP